MLLWANRRNNIHDLVRLNFLLSRSKQVVNRLIIGIYRGVGIIPFVTAAKDDTWLAKWATEYFYEATT